MKPLTTELSTKRQNVLVLQLGNQADLYATGAVQYIRRCYMLAQTFQVAPPYSKRSVSGLQACLATPQVLWM